MYAKGDINSGSGDFIVSFKKLEPCMESTVKAHADKSWLMLFIRGTVTFFIKCNMSGSRKM